MRPKTGPTNYRAERPVSDELPAVRRGVRYRNDNDVEFEGSRAGYTRDDAVIAFLITEIFRMNIAQPRA